MMITAASTAEGTAPRSAQIGPQCCRSKERHIAAGRFSPRTIYHDSVSAGGRDEAGGD
jgi:hypothetical protein